MSSKYTKRERLEIGKKIFTKEMSQAEAAVRNDINPYTVREYYRLYKAYVKVREEENKAAPMERENMGEKTMCRKDEMRPGRFF